MKITDNTVMITGGASGIGLALTRAFLENGSRVIVVGRNPDKLAEVKQSHTDIVTHICDISKPESQDDLVLFIETQYPDINILINNAGVQYNYHSVDDFSVAHHVRSEIDINLAGPIRLCQLLIPTLLQQKNAAIVNVSSALAFTPKKSAPVYCATKAGLHIFTKALRYQLERTNVKVFEIIPSIVNTEMTKGRGKGKISPETLVSEFLHAFEKDQYEINIGKTKVLRTLARFFPTLADNIIKNND